MSVQFARASSQELTAPRGRHMSGGALFARLVTLRSDRPINHAPIGGGAGEGPSRADGGGVKKLYGGALFARLANTATMAIQTLGFLAFLAAAIVPLWWLTP